MKRKSAHTKRKTKGLEQFKSFAIAILAVVLLVIIAASAKDYFNIGSSSAARLKKTTKIAVERDWPSMRPKPTTQFQGEVGPALPGGPGPAAPLPGPSDIQTPYAFVKAVGNNSYGPVYYSPGSVLPTVLFAGNAMTPVPSGNFVFTIRIDATMSGGFPSRTTPIKINTTTGAVTALAAPRDYPRMWNYLVPADNGNDYIYGAISIDSSDYLTGPIYIVNNGVQVYTATGSYLQPTISTDGTKAAWAYKPSPIWDFGDRDMYLFDVATKVATKIKDVGADQETIGPTMTIGGRVTVFTIAIYQPDIGLYDQEIWHKLLNAPASVRILVTDYKWNEYPRIARAYTRPEDIKLVWHANKDSNTHGYNILYIAFSPLYPAFTVRELTVYSANVQKLWPDVDNNGFVLFSDELSYWYNYAIYMAHTSLPGWMTQVINPGGISRDVRFIN